MMSAPNLVEGRIGEWMQVASGGKFFPQDPRPEEINIDDIANGLALTCRYGGQGDINKFYSVAEHSMLMAKYTFEHTIHPTLFLEGRKIKILLTLVILLHDAAEAYVGDLIRSVKSAVRNTYGPLEDNIQSVILNKYGLFEAALNFSDEVKEIDNRIVVNEKSALFNSPLVWASDTLEPLPDVKIHCYDPPTAKKMWLNLFHKLMYSSELCNFDAGIAHVRER